VPTKYIAEYITYNEYTCTCCSALPPDFDPEDIAAPYQILFDSFKWIREEWGKPIWINSGYRCPVHNAFVGGKVLSAHMWGLALDLTADSYEETLKLEDVIEEVAPDLRRGTYPSRKFIHIDTAYFIYPKASHSWVEGKRWT